MRPRLTLLGVLLGALFAVPPLAAGADRGDTADKAAAREHYEKGTSYYDLGRYPDAIKEFEAAYEIKKDPALLYNLAQAYRLGGNPEQALHFYKTYLRYVPRPPNRAEIEDRITGLEKQVAELKQPPPSRDIIPPAPSAAATTPDAPGAANAPASANPADQERTTDRAPPPGAPPAAPPVPPTTSPAVAAPAAPGSQPNVLTSAPSAGPASSSGASGTARTLEVTGLASAGVGAALIVAGAIEGARAKQASRDVENQITFDPSVESRGKSAEKAEWWLLGLGLVAGGGGAALYFYGRHLGNHAGSASGGDGPRASLAPVLTPGGAGATVRVRF